MSKRSSRTHKSKKNDTKRNLSHVVDQGHIVNWYTVQHHQAVNDQ